MQTSLIDPEGFPRADIDVASIRTARVQIIRLRNDLKAVMEEMAALLERGLPKTSAVGMEVEEDVVIGVGFAKVNSVAKDSPAESAVRQSEGYLR